MIKTHTFVVLDTETGGLSPIENSIIEIAAMVVDVEYLGKDRGFGFRHGERFETKCKPVRPVGEVAAEINGYNEQDWADALPEYDALKSFFGFMESAPKGSMWCGSNPDFDLRFLEAATRRCGLMKNDPDLGPIMPTTNMSHRILNTASLCMPLMLFGETKGVGIKHLRKWAGGTGDQAHRAMVDVEDTVLVLQCYLTSLADIYTVKDPTTAGGAS